MTATGGSNGRVYSGRLFNVTGSGVGTVLLSLTGNGIVHRLGISSGTPNTGAFQIIIDGELSNWTELQFLESINSALDKAVDVDIPFEESFVIMTSNVVVLSLFGIYMLGL